MTYYKQWDRSDIDSWQGNDVVSVREQEDTEAVRILKAERFVNTRMDLMEDYGLSWRDFV